MMVYGVKELNFALKSLITFLSLSNIFLRTTAFSTPPFSTLSCESGVSKSVLFLNGSNNEIQFETDRRDLLGKSLKSFAIVGVGLSVANVQDASAAFNTRIGGLPNKIRNICVVMDELQRDLMQERWDLVEEYPAQFRSYVPVFTTYTDAAFPTDSPTDYSLRVALRYEVGRLFAALSRLQKATARRSLDEAYIAYSEMAIHFDRYLHAGNLYTYEDNVVDYSKFYEGISNSALVYADIKKDPPLVRDLILLVDGPDKGKTGIMIGIYKDGSGKCVVKLDKYRSKYGIREIRIVPVAWAGKRIGEQDPDEVFTIPRKK